MHIVYPWLRNKSIFRHPMNVSLPLVTKITSPIFHFIRKTFAVNLQVEPRKMRIYIYIERERERERVARFFFF